MGFFKYIIKAVCFFPSTQNNTKPTVTETILGHFSFFPLQNAYFKNEELKVLTEKIFLLELLIPIIF